ncbi:MAG: SufS family cysteine desulfurase [Phycisphaerae bacterium]
MRQGSATFAQGEATATLAPFDVTRVREDFPALSQSINAGPLVYLDNAATTQKPRVVLETLRRYYETENANIHRGVHQLSMRATDAHEQAREDVRQFINAASTEEVIFVRGATEAINLVAQSYARPRLQAGDEVLISAMEHHSNIVPWQILCEQSGARLRIVPISDRGEILLSEYERLLNPRTRLVGIVHVSNALGTINPVRKMVEIAHRHDVPILIDGAQSVAHLKVDVRALDGDFLAFSGHKLFAPTGIGVLYARRELLDQMPPYQAGGDMISSVTFEKTTYNVLPYKFEAGTPNIAGAVGLGAAIGYIRQIGLDHIAAYEHELLTYATAALSAIPQVRLIGTAPEKTAVLSFVIDGVHPHDAGTILDQQGIAIRAGHHCAQPVMRRFGVPATVRASLAFYNTKAEINALVQGVRKVVEVFS